MKLNSHKSAVIAASVVLVSILAFGQEKSQQSSPQKDSFVGSWKLNVAKSSLPPESATITIEPQGSEYKISYSVRYPSGTESTFWILTDMKGMVSKLTQTNGKAMNEEWLVTRQSSESFVVQSRPFASTVSYTVSKDGKTLMKKQLQSSILGGRLENGEVKPSVQMLVFDRVQ